VEVPVTVMVGLRLPPSRIAPGLARRAVHELSPWIESHLPTVELLVSELVSNCVQHAHLLPSDRIDLTVEDLGRSVRVEVTDPGRAYDDAWAAWSHVGDARSGARPSVEHGFGLRIVNVVADRCGLRWDDGTRAWFEMTLDPTANP
jgi:anti-sigma regulatory factor (Ser/Thr protein kinase)